MYFISVLTRGWILWQWFSERILVQMWRIQEKKSQGWWIKSTLNFAIHIHDQSTKHLSDIAFIDCLIEMCVLIVSTNLTLSRTIFTLFLLKRDTCLVRCFQICAPAWPLAGTVSVYRPCYILTKSCRLFWLLIKSWYTFDTRKELQEVEKEMCKGSRVMRGQQHLSKQKKSGNLVAGNGKRPAHRELLLLLEYNGKSREMTQQVKMSIPTTWVWASGHTGGQLGSAASEIRKDILPQRGGRRELAPKSSVSPTGTHIKINK